MEERGRRPSDRIKYSDPRNFSRNSHNSWLREKEVGGVTGRLEKVPSLDPCTKISKS